MFVYESARHCSSCQADEEVIDVDVTRCGGCDSVYGWDVVEFGESIKNPAYRILQTEYSGCLDISAHA